MIADLLVRTQERERPLICVFDGSSCRVGSLSVRLVTDYDVHTSPNTTVVVLTEGPHLRGRDVGLPPDPPGVPPPVLPL